MATMNFSIPEDVKERFNRTFANANKSAVVTQLLEEAIERAERKRQSDEAIQRIKSRWHQRPILTEEEIVQAREDGRP
jgi:hypothetical protein